MSDSNSTVRIKIFPLNKEITVPKNSNLFFELQKKNIPIDGICGGNMVCGKCAVQILSGGTTPPSPSDLKFFTSEQIESNFRLACTLTVEKNMIIQIPEEHLVSNIIHIEELDKITVKVNTIFDIIKNRNSKELFFNNEKISVFTAESNIYGIAFDIGTTTIVAALINLETGEIVNEEFRLNPQQKYGADIISRITYTMQNPNGENDLQDILISILNNIIESFVIKNKINKEQIMFTVISSNAVINHSLLKEKLSSFSTYPYKPVFRKKDFIKCKEINIRINDSGLLFIVPNIDGFVGGDITSDIISSKFGSKQLNELLIDIGTNGEMVLNTKGKLTATSTAAGPAFEGAKIRFGMIAKEGAIDRVSIVDNDIEINVIGNAHPTGICGTGIITAIASFLKLNWIDYTGKILPEQCGDRYFEDTEHNIRAIKLTDKIYITQQDIREFQLAKGAIYAGISLLLKKFNLTINDLDKMYIAGSFGKYLDIDNAVLLKMFPKIDSNKIQFIGNGSLHGASLILLNKEKIQEALNIVDSISFFELANSSEFQNFYIEESLYFNIPGDSMYFRSK